MTAHPVPADVARELEADLDKYPDERGEILLEAAYSWQHAGEHGRAIELLNEAIAIGGEDGQHARTALADVLFDLDRTEEARAQLDMLRADRPGVSTCVLAGELLEEREEYQDALTWFNMAVCRLDETELATLTEPGGWLSYAATVVRGRRRVREALGIPTDKLDESVPEVPALPGTAPFMNPDEIASALEERVPAEVQVLYWPRSEVPLAHERWPQLVESGDADEFIRNREAANRELSDSGLARIVMVPLTVARLTEFAARTGGDPADSETRRACMAEILSDGGQISWPPSRNAPCWCGSATKYKKCCGRPNNT